MEDWYDEETGFWETEDDSIDTRDELEDALAECGLDPETGHCGHAGTEHCAFRCIFHPERR